jgi:chromosome segregation ATPase
LEGGITAGTLGEADAKAAQSALPQWKSELEAKTTELQACQVIEGDASSQLRNDQAKLAELQDRIDRFDKTLERLSSAGK